MTRLFFLKHFEKVTKLAHSGAHQGKNGLIQRWRSCLFIKNLEKQAAEYPNCYLTAKYLQIRFIGTQSKPVKYVKDNGKRLRH